MGKRIGAIASTMGLVVALLAVTGAVAGTTDTQFTACLSDKGALTDVAEGLEPSEACKKDARVVTWSSQGPVGLQGPAGIDGTHGDDGIDGRNGTDGTDGVDGAQGDPGTDGADGQPGNPCEVGVTSIEDDGTTTYSMTCEDSSVVWTGLTPIDPNAPLAAIGYGPNEWFRVEDTNLNDVLDAGDTVKISLLPAADPDSDYGACVMTTVSNGSFEISEIGEFGDLGAGGTLEYFPVVFFEGLDSDGQPADRSLGLGSTIGTPYGFIAGGASYGGGLMTDLGLKVWGFSSTWGIHVEAFDDGDTWGFPYVYGSEDFSCFGDVPDHRMWASGFHGITGGRVGVPYIVGS